MARSTLTLPVLLAIAGTPAAADEPEAPGDGLNDGGGPATKEQR